VWSLGHSPRENTGEPAPRLPPIMPLSNLYEGARQSSHSAETGATMGLAVDQAIAHAVVASLGCASLVKATAARVLHRSGER
jgi:hypothetical protein